MELFLYILIAFGVYSIYDARKIANKYFSKQDINTVVFFMKAVGFLVCIVCAVLICVMQSR